MGKRKQKKCEKTKAPSSPVANIRENMMLDYNSGIRDWFGIHIGKSSFMTFHHIIPKHLEGPNTRGNGSILSSIIHPLVHIVERYDYIMFEYLTESFQYINDNEKYPQYNQVLMLQNTLQYFIKLYNNTLSESEYRIAKECNKILNFEKERIINEQRSYCKEKIKGSS